MLKISHLPRIMIRMKRKGKACLLYTSTFNALAEHFAAIFIHTVDIAGGVQGVGGAAARAVQALSLIHIFRGKAKGGNNGFQHGAAGQKLLIISR